MTIIRKGVKKIGTAWSRKVNINVIPNDGNGSILHAMILPPYVWPGMMWAKWKLIDNASGDTVDPRKSAEANVFIQMVELPDDLVPANYDSDAELLSLANTHAPLDEIFLGTDSGTDDDVGITGHAATEIPDIFARSLVKRYHYKMGIGQNAYPTNANFIRYHVQGRYRGEMKTSNMVDITKPKLVVIRGNTNIPSVNADEDKALSGDYSIYDLYQLLVDQLPQNNQNEVDSRLIDENLNTYLQYYLNEGIDGGETASNFFEARALNATTYVTTRLDIYEPSPTGQINVRNHS